MGQQKSNHLAHYAEITTIHGIKDLVFSRSRVLRLVWSLFLVATMGWLSWEIYDTVKYYLNGPTTMIPSNVRLETYPPIHVCSTDWLDATQARPYNFSMSETAYLTWYFLSFLGSTSQLRGMMSYSPRYQSIIKSIKNKMKQYNWSSFQDMMSILSWNVSVESQGDTATIKKRLLWSDSVYFCQSISNVNRNEDLEIKFPRSFIVDQRFNDKYIIVGEDFYGEQVYINEEDCSIFNVKIQGIKKKILLNRPRSECMADYDSAQACLLDCGYKRLVCNCNGTASTTSYDNIDISLIFDMLKCYESPNISSSCSQRYGYCTAPCKPCVSWNYHFTLIEEREASDNNKNNVLYDYDDPDNYFDFNYLLSPTPNVSLQFKRVPGMEVTEQAYSYTASSMVSYIGGLLGLFCGASVLSFVQAFLFWWGDECHIGKGKVEETVVEDIAKQDNIQSWVQQATLHIPQCKPCSTVTATKMQSQKSDEAQTSLQETSHVANYANNTTIHGIKDFLFVKNKPLKLIWGLFLLAVTSIMCEELYRTVMNYIRAPTARSISFVDLDTYPTIHVCSDNWYNDIQARSYGFMQEDLAFIRLAFQEPETPGDEDMWMMMKSIEGNNTAFEEQKKSVQHKMEQHNLKTVGDMLNLITWNLSIEGQGFVNSKRWRGRGLETVNSTYVCHSVSNASVEHDLSITLPEDASSDEFIVVGEDPFAESIKYGYFDGSSKWISRRLTLKIWDINKRSLLGKDGECNKGYNSFGVCRQDCASQKDLCNCNGTIKNASYDNNEDFFLLVSLHDCRDDASCNQNYDRCVEMCEPCTTWDYQVTTMAYGIDDADGPLNITMVPRMKVSEEYYTFPLRSLLSNIGGLMGMFCGASILSLAQLLLFWLDDGCFLSKTKGTNRGNTDHHIKAWLQQAALRIPQCELCKKLTSMRTQNKEGGEIKTSQQKNSHLANYADNTTIHGIKDLVFCKNKLIKFAWSLILLVVFCLMCEEIYGTVSDYAGHPTDIDETIIRMEKYPPLHACISANRVYEPHMAKKYGFGVDEIAIISSVFNGSQVPVNDTQRASITRKMKEHNLTTVRDMLNIVTVNASIDEGSMFPDDPAPQKRWRREDNGVDYVCYTFSNFTVRDGGLIIISLGLSEKFTAFVIIGEDPFGLHYESAVNTLSKQSIEVFIRESNKLSLINKGGACSDDYTSSGVCLQDCISKETACNRNSTKRLPSYENNETFWHFVDRPEYANTTCQPSPENCTAKCKLIPCATWTYQSSVLPLRGVLSNFYFLKLNFIPRMIESKEYYTYTASSLLANIGGLVSLLCGGSLLSIVQMILFWWGDGCCSRKGTERKEEIAVIPEDNIHKWIQHVALHRT